MSYLSRLSVLFPFPTILVYQVLFFSNGCSSSHVPSQESISGGLQLGFGTVKYGSWRLNSPEKDSSETTQ